MKVLGSFLKYFLNINTIWGLMILAAFGLCLAQHYLPTTTVIPADELSPGDNTLTILMRRGDGELETFRFQLAVGEDGAATLEPRSQDEGPWLISIRTADGAYLLKWDDAGYGKYEMAINGTVVAGGQLVTLQSLTDAAFDYATSGFDIALGLVAAMVLFLGLMKVGEDAGIVQLVARMFYPIIRFLFPEVPKEHPANGAILMNVTTTILGLGNAATPFGLKAMKELQSLNRHPEVATDAQVMLLGYNTAGLALLPTTLLAVRKASGCSDPFEIIGTCMLTGAVSTVVAIFMARTLGKLPFFTVRAALAEGEAARATPATTAGTAVSASDSADSREPADRSGAPDSEEGRS